MFEMVSEAKWLYGGRYEGGDQSRSVISMGYESHQCSMSCILYRWNLLVVNDMQILLLFPLLLLGHWWQIVVCRASVSLL